MNRRQWARRAVEDSSQRIIAAGLVGLPLVLFACGVYETKPIRLVESGETAGKSNGCRRQSGTEVRMSFTEWFIVLAPIVILACMLLLAIDRAKRRGIWH